jgi:hypothetical protein
MLKDAPGSGLLPVRPDSAHWYSKDGKPRHDATLREARVDGLYPSVTSILSVWPKPALDHYKTEQAIVAAITLPRNAGEDDASFASRILDRSEEHRNAAAEFGSRIHEMARAVAVNKADESTFMGTEIEGYAMQFCKWFRLNIKEVVLAEQPVVCHEHGYAGTFDLIAVTAQHGVALIDFKTQGVKQKVKFYDTWDFQLAAYQYALYERASMIENRVSVVLNSKAAEYPSEHCWSQDSGSEAMSKFLICNAMWRAHRKYFPGTTNVTKEKA